MLVLKDATGPTSPLDMIAFTHAAQLALRFIGARDSSQPRDQLDEPEQIIRAEAASVASRLVKRIRLGEACPPDGHAANSSCLVPKVDAVFAPSLLVRDELELKP